MTTSRRPDPLEAYKARRDFSRTPEPAGGRPCAGQPLRFVVQRHWASRLHDDFRLELDGTLKSWAVPKGPSLDPKDKRLAVQVEDHPLDYADFEGHIPPGQYGAGRVVVWDTGTWVPLGDAQAGLKNGQLKFELHGHKLKGRWVLVRLKGQERDRQPAWLLIKEHDAHERPAAESAVVEAEPDSVKGLAEPLAPQPTQPPHSPPPVADKPVRAAPASSRLTRPGADVSPVRAEPGEALARFPPLPPGAVPAPLPEQLAPQLATLVQAPPEDAENWMFEAKFDGYRVLTRVLGARVQLFTRTGQDWTHRLPHLHQVLSGMGLPSGWYDGEIVVAGAHGMPDFGALQRSFDAERTRDVVLHLFDVPCAAGHDLRALPLQARRDWLAQLLASSHLREAAQDTVRFSAVFDAAPQQLLQSACRLGLEGVIGKRRNAPYRSTRNLDWIKLKCAQRQAFVVGGYTEPQGTRSVLGALLLGVFDASGALRPVGKVGTGFNQQNLRELQARLHPLRQPHSPFTGPVPAAGQAHWVAPRLVAQVSFAEWTHGGQVRQAVFLGLRDDKRPREIVREEPRPAPNGAYSHARTAAAADKGQAPSAEPTQPASAASRTTTRATPEATTKRKPAAPPPASPPANAGKTNNATEPPSPSRLRITHPERVIDPATGFTKGDLVRLYDAVAELMLPHLKGRPVSLLRAPDGLGGELFFQKHASTDTLPGVKHLDPALDPGHAPLIEVGSRSGLLACAQWNVLEFHTQNCKAADATHPDRIVFDLDPGEGVAWAQVREAAELARAFLQQLGLVPFLKTSGGKGLHVVVPLRREHDWASAKAFSKAVVQHMSRTIPQRFVARSGPKNRVGKIYIDYLRNGPGATTVCAWSVRARPGLGLSVPLDWSELPALRGSDHWNAHNVHERLATGNTPWQAYARSARALHAAIKTLADAA